MDLGGGGEVEGEVFLGETPEGDIEPNEKWPKSAKIIVIILSILIVAVVVVAITLFFLLDDKSKQEQSGTETEEEKKRKEEERKREIQRRKEEAEKRREEAKKKEANKTVSNPFQLPKKKFFSSYKVPKNELPEGVVEMTVIDKGIGFIDGKRHHRFVHNKVMADGSKVSEEVNKCLD